MGRGNGRLPRGPPPRRVYALQWVNERRLPPTTYEVYRGLLRLHILPAFECLDLD
jgi:hypothetical protein